MSVNCAQVLKLYKTLLFEASKFPIYNFRMYALRRIRDKFKENKSLTDSISIEDQYKQGQQALDLIKRQVIVSQLYNPKQLVLEKMKEKNG